MLSVALATGREALRAPARLFESAIAVALRVDSAGADLTFAWRSCIWERGALTLAWRSWMWAIGALTLAMRLWE